jgi:hydrogenase maturation protease
MGKRPGEWARLRTEDLNLPRAAGGLSSHGPGLIEALELGSAIGLAVPEVVIYGIQPGDSDWSTELSHPVRTAVPAVCEAIVEDLSTFPLPRKGVEEPVPLQCAPLLGSLPGEGASRR